MVQLSLISESADGMQTLLKDLEAYCRKWHLIINSQKSKVTIFRKSGKCTAQDNHDFIIENEKL